jgi:hypothetical protein
LGRATLDEKVTAQRQVRDLEKQRNRKRRELYDEQDRIEAQRDELIGKIERQLVMTHEVVELFVIRWMLQ